MADTLLRTLALAIELAERKRDAAAAVLGQARQRCLTAEQQMAQLTGYAAETDQRWQQRGSVQPELMQHHHRFMARLDEAIAMQRRVIADLLARQEQARQALLQTELRLATLTKARQLRQDALALAQRRREQRQTDEMAATRHAMTVRQAAEELEHGY